MVNHRTLTSAMIDSRDFLAAKRRADNEVLLPAGPKIAFTGGIDFNDHRAIWIGSTRSTPSTPTWCYCTAARRQAPSASPPAGPITARCRTIAFKPDWNAHAKAAPFKRNDELLDGAADRCHRLPGSGIQAISPTRRRNSASRSGSSAAAARERQCMQHC